MNFGLVEGEDDDDTTTFLRLWTIGWAGAALPGKGVRGIVVRGRTTGKRYAGSALCRDITILIMSCRPNLPVWGSFGDRTQG